MAYGYNYGGYPVPNGGYYQPPVPDQLAQLRQNQYQNPIMQQQPMMQNQPMQGMGQMPQTQVQNYNNGNGIVWVSSEREASEYPLAINSAVALWDSNQPIIYLKQSDASGKPSMKIYDLVERNPQQNQPVQSHPMNNYVTRAEFDALAAELAALKNASKPAEKEGN